MQVVKVPNKMQGNVDCLLGVEGVGCCCSGGESLCFVESPAAETECRVRRSWLRGGSRYDSCRSIFTRGFRGCRAAQRRANPELYVPYERVMCRRYIVNVIGTFLTESSYTGTFIETEVISRRPAEPTVNAICHDRK